MTDRRRQLVTEVRRQLYTTEAATVCKMAKRYGIETAELTDGELLEVVEIEIGKSEEGNEDKGIKWLMEWLEAMRSLDSVGKTVASFPSMRLAGWRKEFKLSGQVGEGSNSLAYMGFLRQVTAGQEKGYTDREIVDGIIRSIQPWLPGGPR
jgi:hypothetical protein